MQIGSTQRQLHSFYSDLPEFRSSVEQAFRHVNGIKRRRPILFGRIGSVGNIDLTLPGFLFNLFPAGGGGEAMPASRENP